MMAMATYPRCDWCREVILDSDRHVEHVDVTRRRRLILHRRVCAVEYVARTFAVSDAAAEDLISRITGTSH